MLRFKKSLNNNVALAINANGDELVLFGTGLGFGKKAGDMINQADITKIFHSTEEIHSLFNTIPFDVIETTHFVILDGQQKIGAKLADTLIVSLADHLNFAIERCKQCVPIKNPMHWEIKHLYPLEYGVGVSSLDIIATRLGIQLPEEEAPFIALHFVCAQCEPNEQNRIVQINKLISEIINIVTEQLGKEPDKSSIDYSRFITHLRYFIMRYQDNKPFVIKDNDFLYDTLKVRYQQSYQCVNAIHDFLQQHLSWELNIDEVVCLMIHIERLRGGLYE